MYSPEELLKIIEQNDITALSKVSGIGKKGAGRIILELKGKLDFSEFSDDFVEAGGEVFKDAREALVNLGYKTDDINIVLKKAEKELKDLSVENIIKYALKNIEK
jgi:Holliday junction DNA helicase RuvA